MPQYAYKHREGSQLTVNVGGIQVPPKGLVFPNDRSDLNKFVPGMLDRYIDGVLNNSVATQVASKELAGVTVGTAANTTETNLLSRLIDNESLQPGKGVVVRVWGKTAANANTKRLRAYLGSTLVADSTALALNGTHFLAEFFVVGTPDQKQSVSAGVRSNSATLNVMNNVVATAPLTADILFRFTGTNGTAAANDIQVLGAVIEPLG